MQSGKDLKLGAESSQRNHYSVRDWMLFSIFFLSLQPYSISLGGSGVSASYFFLLLFLIPIRKIAITQSALAYVLAFYLIFLAGIPKFVSAEPYYQLRTLLSFVAFISPLLLLFIRFARHDLTLFVYAVIAASLYYSIGSIITYSLNQSLDVFTLKGIIGSQRYGFVICLGFFLVLFHRTLGAVVKPMLLLILLFGALLTFSRSTLISLGSALAFVGAMSLTRPIKLRWERSALFGVLVSLLALVIAVYFSYAHLAGLWSFFNSRLVLPFLDGSLFDSIGTLDPDSSEGYRVYVLTQIFAYLLEHPFTGSNYSGLYLLYEEYGGSASTHGDYNDVLLRTGLLGFGLYLYLLIKMLKFYKAEKGVFIGLISIVVYGFFHEAFRLGHGAFIFGFLLSYQFWIKRQRLVKPRPISDQSLQTKVVTAG